MDHQTTRRPGVSVAASASAKRAPAALSILFGTVMLLGVLGMLGRPAVFPDTSAYVRYGAAFYHLAGQALKLEPPPPPKTARQAARDRLDLSYELTVVGARSPWYGVLLWPLQRYGTIWLVAAVQSALGAWLIWLLWRTIVPGARAWTAFAVQGATALFSTLPFIAGFAMPDVFTAYLILSTALLLASWDRLARLEKAVLLLLIIYSCRVHGANTLLCASMTGAAVVVLLASRIDRRPLRIAILAIMLSLAAGFGLGRLTDFAISRATGQAPGRPPFLAARLIADGPGRRYLRRACADAAPYTLCRFKSLPLDDVQDMLWSWDRRKSVFPVSNPQQRMALEHEEARFVAGVVLSDPLGVALSSLGNWGQQLGMVAVQSPLIDPELYVAEYPYSQSPLRGMVERIGSCGPDHHGCRTRLTIETADWLQTAEFLIAAGLAGWVAAPRVRRLLRRQALEDPRWLLAATFVTIGLLANALLYGAIAGPFPRYQSAVAWLATTIAALGVVRYRFNSARPRSDN